MRLSEFKDVANGDLFGTKYYRTATFWSSMILPLLALGDVATFARDLYTHDYSLLVTAWLPLVGLAVVIVLSWCVFGLWLSRMRVLFSGAENVDVTALVKKAAGDFLRLFALLALCTMVGLFVAQNISGY
ncbi:MAG TPA: hypothetical protein VMT28_00880 [Terriglobales bacterium]|jgi:hypothetical protein|nr:hypothetical protein [Terriglobales bacterium]